MQVDLNFDLVGLDGAKVAVAGELIAGLLMSEAKGDAVKFYDWDVVTRRWEKVLQLSNI